ERLRGSVPPPRCPACQTEATLEHAWVHAFHPTAGRDLVMRWSADPGAVDRLWWDEHGEEPAHLDGEQAGALLRAETVRALSVLATTRPLDLASELGRALQRWTRERGLMQLLPNLLE